MDMFKKGCLPRVTEEELDLCGWSTEAADFSDTAGPSTMEVNAQQDTFEEYMERYNAMMPADCAKIQPIDISTFSAGAKLLACCADDFDEPFIHVRDNFPINLFLYVSYTVTRGKVICCSTNPQSGVHTMAT